MRASDGGHGLDAACVPIHFRPERLRDGIAGLKALDNMDGFIVTAPVYADDGAVSDEVVGEGRLVGAVNTIRSRGGRAPVGRPVRRPRFRRGTGCAPWHRILSARAHLHGRGGGAGNAVASALARAKVAAITLHNRTVAKAQNLAQRLRAAHPQCDIRVGPKDPRGHDIAVNATSVGLAPGRPAVLSTCRRCRFLRWSPKSS